MNIESKMIYSAIVIIISISFGYIFGLIVDDLNNVQITATFQDVTTDITSQVITTKIEQLDWSDLHGNQTAIKSYEYIFCSWSGIALTDEECREQYERRQFIVTELLQLKIDRLEQRVSELEGLHFTADESKK